MKETPIIFNTEMVRAIKEGHKTQTRRLNGLDKVNANPHLYIHHLLNGSLEGEYSLLKRDSALEVIHLKCPYGKPGDLIWVKETFSTYKNGLIFRADVCSKYDLPDGCVWKSSIHMPKTACRYWLEIVSIRLERLKDITDADAIAEGIEHVKLDGTPLDAWMDYSPDKKSTHYYLNPYNSFWSLWESVFGKNSFLINPWVWRIEFKPFQP